ncbi:MAG: STM4012 family radical SAM protein [Azonexus sp.]
MNDFIAAPRLAESLAERLAARAYTAYSYSYPHKTAYRPLAEPVPLAPLWAAEKRDALFLYLHIPFCEMRCGFCNLFTMARPDPELPRRYVAQVLQQMAVTADLLGTPKIARFALGGGTPTYLGMAELEALLAGTQRHFAVDFGQVPGGVEVSPETASREKLALLRASGLQRVSIGVQSFLEAETQTLVRRQPGKQLAATLERIRDWGPPTLNLDLIYGIPGQTPASFVASLKQALDWQPEEIYLYPLYVRRLTGLDRIASRHPERYPEIRVQAAANRQRAHLYQAGRDLLLAAGYEQVSMRMFQRPTGLAVKAPVYCCQEDGMIGLGSGARSYTQQLHYASEYAVGRLSTRELIEQYCARPAEWFTAAHHGIPLDADEQRRRFVIQSLLTQPGLDLTAYARRFAGADPLTDFPFLEELQQAGLLTCNTSLQLTPAGLALSDSIGPKLISPAVQARMDAYALS